MHFVGISTGWIKLDGRTVREYFYQYYHNNNMLLRDRRGTHVRQLVVLEEDLKIRLLKWARKHASEPDFYPKCAHTAFTQHKLGNSSSVAFILISFNIVCLHMFSGR